MNAMKPRSSVFSKVGGLHPKYSVFDLSYVKTMTADMGILYPVMCDEVVPGDIFKIGNQMVLRFQPMLAPILHEINAYVHYFFVPYRLLWDSWEDFITGGPQGNLTPSLPTWIGDDTTANVGSLWDYFGFQTIAPSSGLTTTPTAAPLVFPKRAYNLVWNEYYRDETLQSEVSLDSNDLQYRNWEKDYFTSSLPWQQRGQAPALPISGTVSAVWGFDQNINFPELSTGTIYNLQYRQNGSSVGVNPGESATVFNQGFIPKANLNNNTINLGTATTFNVADLRLAFQIQKFLERNARAGARYTEFLRSHFGVSPRDERLQRPEYIGGSKAPVIISEVLQTGSSDATSPQGNMAGHGISVNSQFCGKYRASEFGVIIGMLSVMPRSMYQTGHDRQWLRRTKYDFYFPEFANLSEQAILNAEIYCSANDTTDKSIFGYQGRYDEMRTKRNQVCGQMRDIFDYWHLGRQFTTTPGLNSSFIQCNPANTKRIFAVESEPGIILQFANLIKAWRPMPIQSEPGLIDHN